MPMISDEEFAQFQALKAGGGQGVAGAVAQQAPAFAAAPGAMGAGRLGTGAAGGLAQAFQAQQGQQFAAPGAGAFRPEDFQRAAAAGGADVDRANLARQVALRAATGTAFGGAGQAAAAAQERARTPAVQQAQAQTPGEDEEAQRARREQSGSGAGV